MSDDPFERAIRKEQQLRQQSPADSRKMLALASWAYIAFLFGWAGVLFAHHRIWAEPDWLRVLHTVVFCVVALCCLIAMAFSRVMMRRYLPDDLTYTEPPS